MARQLDIKVNTPVCTGCHLCEMVCSLRHEDLINMDKARIRVTDRWDESLFVPHICQLCEPPDCVEACPTSALAQDSRGIVRVERNCYIVYGEFQSHLVYRYKWGHNLDFRYIGRMPAGGVRATISKRSTTKDTIPPLTWARLSFVSLSLLQYLGFGNTNFNPTRSLFLKQHSTARIFAAPSPVHCRH